MRFWNIFYGKVYQNLLVFNLDGGKKLIAQVVESIYIFTTQKFLRNSNITEICKMGLLIFKRRGSNIFYEFWRYVNKWYNIWYNLFTDQIKKIQNGVWTKKMYLHIVFKIQSPVSAASPKSTMKMGTYWHSDLWGKVKQLFWRVLVLGTIGGPLAQLH